MTEMLSHIPISHRFTPKLRKNERRDQLQRDQIGTRVRLQL